MMINKLILALIISLTVSNVSQAQTDSCVNSLHENMNALLFQVNNYSSFQGYDGKLLSWKKQYNSEQALRVGVSMYGNHEDTYKTDKATSNHTSYANIRISVLKQEYLNSESIFNFYYGYGVIVGLEHTWNRPDGNNDRNIWSAGIIGALGAEWFPQKNLSFSLEYSGNATISYSNYGYYDDYTDINYIYHIYKVNVHDYTYSFNQQSVKLGVEVYFKMK